MLSAPLRQKVENTLQAIFIGSIGTIADTSLLKVKAFNPSSEQHRLTWEWSPIEYCHMPKMVGGIKRIQRYADANCKKVDEKFSHYTKIHIFSKYALKRDHGPSPKNYGSF